MSERKPLIVNTRPTQQAVALSELLKKNNFDVVEFPLIEIKESGKLKSFTQQQLNHYNTLIFISANAVIFYFKYYSLPENATVAVIGKATAKIFSQYAGKNADIIPTNGSDSESLLDHKLLHNISFFSILIIRGAGGREYLAQQLRERQAKVDYMEVYHRICPKYELDYLDNLWHNYSIGFMLISSVESLENLLQLSQVAGQSVKRSEILTTNIIVMHKNIKEKLIEYDFLGDILISDQSNNESIVKKLSQYYKNYYQNYS